MTECMNYATLLQIMHNTQLTGTLSTGEHNRTASECSDKSCI